MFFTVDVLISFFGATNIKTIKFNQISERVLRCWKRFIAI